MSQSGLTDPARDGEWDVWYTAHLTLMAGVPGIASAQRFKTETPGYPPSLAMYSVASLNVFQDPYYLSVRGMGDWLALIDWRYYKRNLFEGAQFAPVVNEGEILLVADREAPDAALGAGWTWLECVGIDRSTPYRGIAVASAEQLPSLAPEAGIAVYRAATPRHAPR